MWTKPSGSFPEPRHEDANGSDFADGQLQNQRYDSEMRLANPRHSRFQRFVLSSKLVAERSSTSNLWWADTRDNVAFDSNSCGDQEFD